MKVCGIKNLKISEEDNKETFKNYLISIGAYNETTKQIDIKKLIKSMIKDLPEYGDYLKSMYIELTTKTESHVLIRTRDAKEKTDTEPKDELQKYIEEAKSYYYMSYNDDGRSKLRKYLFNIFYSNIFYNANKTLETIKETMILVCDIISGLPEFKHLVTKFFGEDYRAKINSYTEADYNILSSVGSNHQNHNNPIMSLFDELDEVMKDVTKTWLDPNNKNGYTDVYYK